MHKPEPELETLDHAFAADNLATRLDRPAPKKRRIAPWSRRKVKA